MNQNESNNEPVAEPSTEALFRYQMVSTILARTHCGERLKSVITEIACQRHLTTGGDYRTVSTRTLYRWLYLFQSHGFNGLRRVSRKPMSGSIVLPEGLLDFIRKQKQDDPKSSIPELIRRAELEGIIEADKPVDRTTVWRTMKRMDIDTSRSTVSLKDQDIRRFAFPHRMDMVLCDGKHFRVGVGRLKRVAMFFLDDATRMGIGVVVGTSESAELFLRGLYETLLKYGLMTALFVDNGSGFIANDSIEIMRKLGILFIHGSVAYPQGRGKLERFNRTAKDLVLRQLDNNPGVDPDISSLQVRLRHFLFEHYNKLPHESISHNSPYDVFYQDEKPLRFKKDKTELGSAFILNYKRLVSKDNIVSFNSVHYEVPRGYAGTKVTLYHNVLDNSLSVLAGGVLTKIEPVDLVANARAKRGKPGNIVSDDLKKVLPQSSAGIAYNKKVNPIVDADGGFSIP